MRFRSLAFGCLALIGLGSSLHAQTVCSGRITGPNGKLLPAAHVALQTPERGTVVQIVEASMNGEYQLPVPHSGFWILRFTGVGYAEQKVVLYVPSKVPLKLDVALGCYHYLPDEPRMTVVGDFNLWNIVTGVPLQRESEGLYAASVTTTKDSIEFRIRGYRDGDGVEGIVGASYTVNADGSYNARVTASGGTARIIVNPQLIDRSGTRARIAFVEATEQTQKIAAAVREWWEGDYNHFAAQASIAMGRAPLDTPVVDWSSLVSSLLRQEKAERDPLVRSVLALAHLSTGVKSRHMDVASLTRSLDSLPPTSTVWSLNPRVMSFVVRSVKWSNAKRHAYLESAIRKHPDRDVRAVVLFSEFQMAYRADNDPNSPRYFKLLTTTYADTPEAKQALKEFPQP